MSRKQESITTNERASSCFLYVRVSTKMQVENDKQFSYEEAEMSAEKRPKCPPEKREAILDAFRHFGMID